MTWLMKSLVVIAACTLLMVSATFADDYRRGHCSAAVETELDRLNVNRSDITSLSINRRTRTQGDNEVTDGYDAWVRFKSCKGALVVPMRTSCRVRGSYMRGECGFSGIKRR